MSTDKRLLFLTSPHQLLPSRSIKFAFRLNDEKFEGLVINENGNYYAYLNKCRHMGVTLDWDTGEFYTPDREFLICKTHGAIYKPETGECFGGPCAGKFLFPLPVVQDSGQLFLDLEKVEQLYG